MVGVGVFGLGFARGFWIRFLYMDSFVRMLLIGMEGEWIVGEGKS